MKPLRKEASNPYSPDCLEKLSEKGYKQGSDRKFGWYTEGKKDRKALFGSQQGYAASVSGTFRTVSGSGILGSPYPETCIAPVRRP
jgi:hypothetical protein